METSFGETLQNKRQRLEAFVGGVCYVNKFIFKYVADYGKSLNHS